MSERLTKWFKNVRIACIARTQLHGQILFEAYNLESDDASDVQEALDRLAAYEDTGMTPERAAELAAADKDGRLLVLHGYEGDKIRIAESKTADSRTAQGKVSKEQLLDSSKQHIRDVQRAMSFFMRMLNTAAVLHDWTKIDGIDDFFIPFSQGLKGDEFKQSAWFQRHVHEERHHIKDVCPDDVNLIDLLERISDIVMAGMGRSGSITPDELPDETLRIAYKNTVNLLASHVEVETAQKGGEDA